MHRSNDFSTYPAICPELSGILRSPPFCLAES
jgi:hypothetical protein